MAAKREMGAMTDHTTIKSASRASRTKLAAAARLMIRSICFLFPPVFTWLKLRNLSASDIVKLISDASAGDVVWKTALIIYLNLATIGEPAALTLH